MSEPREPSDIPIVFISSTAEDLRPYRTAARDAAVTAEFFPRMMEYFVASGEKPPLPACLDKVAGAHVVVAIVAHRYGWVPPEQPAGQHKSITWLECERAVADGKKVLALLVDDKAPWPEEHREEYAIAAAIRAGKATPQLLETVQRNVVLLRDFRTWLDGRGLRTTFASAPELRAKVGEALQDWRRRHREFTITAIEEGPSPANPTKYLRALLARTAYIDIRGLQVGSGKAHRFPIEDLYIRLTTTMAPQARGKDAGAKPERGRGATGPEAIAGAPVPLHEVLPHPRVVVVGDPGAGKTTFLRRVAYALCQTVLGDDPEAARARLGIEGRPFPIFVRLADLSEHMAASRRGGAAPRPTAAEAAAWMPHFLAATSKDAGWGLDEGFFRAQLGKGPCLVLFDGLDEAPDRLARESLARLIENISEANDRSRIVVTSRPGAYSGEAVLPGFAQVQIEPLEPEAIQTFLRRWCEALYPGSPSQVEAHLGELMAALRSPEIRRMARNPVMLTALAVVHWNDKRLPEQRADLYDSIIKWLSRSREQRPGRQTAERSVTLLQELALAMQDHPEGRQVQVARRWAAEAIAGEFAGANERERLENTERFLHEEELDSGILVGRGNEVRFWHLTFQEFLAAKAIAGRPEAEQRQVLWGASKTLYTPEWREVALLLGGVLHQQGRQKVDGFMAAALDDLGKAPALADQARCAGLLGAVVRDLEPLQYQVRDPRYPRLLEDVLGIFDAQRSQSIPIEVRIEAAEALGQAGDPRLDPRNPERWVSIPAGKFLMGAQEANRREPNYDPGAYDDEARVHEVHLDAYRIGRYPVTVGEFQRFLEDGGYTDRHWWTAGGFGQSDAPGDWVDQLRFLNRPVVRVSWFEAAAYCMWAGCRLPTEAEWERAARGTEGRRFPWGNERPDPSRLNYSESGVGHATPVGVYPLGATPDGIQDLAGNVWERCQDWFAEDYYGKSPPNNPTGPVTGEARVLRGGSWGSGARYARSANRGGYTPVYLNPNVGFRVVAGVAPRTA